MMLFVVHPRAAAKPSKRFVCSRRMSGLSVCVSHIFIVA